MEQNRLSVGKLFLDLIMRPVSAFQNLAVRTAIWLVIIMAVIAIVFSSAASVIRLNKEFSPEAIMEQPEAKRLIEEGIIEEEVIEEEVIAEVFSAPVFSFGIIAATIFGGLFAFGLGWMVKSSILLGAISLAGGKIGWKESVAVVGASWVPFFFYHLLKGIAALLGWQIASFTGAGAAVLASHLNIFVLWNLALLTIGFAAIAGIPRIKAFACSAGYQAVIILLNWGFDRLAGSITGNMF